MKLNVGSGARLPQRSCRGLTVVELMIAMTLFVLTILGLLACQLFGMKQDELVNSKSGACEQARLSFNDMTRDIKSAKIWAIGNWNGTGFVAIPNGTNQQGNAVSVSLSTDTNQYIVYYFDTNACTLLRWHSGDANKKVLCQYLTNTMFFRAETPFGAVQTDLSHKGVINATMQFCQYQYPLTKIGPNYFYNFYQLGFRLSPHVPDGP